MGLRLLGCYQDDDMTLDVWYGRLIRNPFTSVKANKGRSLILLNKILPSNDYYRRPLVVSSRTCTADCDAFTIQSPQMSESA